MTQVTVHITCLGFLREAIGTDPIDVTCEPIAAAALHALRERFDAIAALEGAVALATDARYLQGDDPIEAGMALVLVPPISGG